MRYMAVLLLALVSTVTLPFPSNAQEPTQTLILDCDAALPGDPYPPGTIAKLEATYLDQTGGAGAGCWAHVGLQQYFVGIDRIYHLKGGTLTVFVKETLLSPSAGDPLAPGVAIEASMDGRSWTTLASALMPSTGNLLRHDFQLPDNDLAFRFLRSRGPISLAAGLSGYIDYTFGSILVRDGGPAPALPAEPVEGEFTYSCVGDILEDPVPWRPCSYGGVHEWDAVSSFHTYFLGDARLDRIRGKATLHIFRHAINGVSPGVTGTTQFHVQTSADGQSWETIASVVAPYNQERTFDVALNDTAAKFVRFAAQKHRDFDDHYNGQGNTPLRRTESFLVASELTLNGAVLLPPSPLLPA